MRALIVLAVILAPTCVTGLVAAPPVTRAALRLMTGSSTAVVRQGDVAGLSASSVGTRISLMRHTRDGAIDPSFGQRGRTFVVQPDGKIVVGEANGSNFDIALLRVWL